MIECLMLLPVVLPALFWAGYHYHKDRHLPEPPGNLLACIVLGIAAAWLSRGLYWSLGLVGLRYDAVALANDFPPGLFAYAVLVIGPVEEITKLLPFLLIVRRFRSFDEPLDGIIYASFIALGYAAAENVYYLQYLSPLESVARGFAGPVVHILFASIWGHWVGLAHIAGRPIVSTAFVSTLVAAVLHGIYDFIVLLKPAGALPVAVLLVVAIWIWRLRLMRLLHLDAVNSGSPGQ